MADGTTGILLKNRTIPITYGDPKGFAHSVGEFLELAKTEEALFMITDEDDKSNDHLMARDTYTRLATLISMRDWHDASAAISWMIHDLAGEIEDGSAPANVGVHMQFLAEIKKLILEQARA